LIRALLPWALALVCATDGRVVEAVAVEPVSVEALSVEGAPAALAGRLRSIRTAFLANSPDQILPCFVRDRPVFVRVSPLDRGVFLGPGPLDAFVRRLFADRVSVDFAVREAPPVSADATRAFVTAAWTYRSSASSTLHVDHLHLVLSHAEHAEWLIVEMKTSTR
jgi:hypothetical protein